MAKYRGTDIDLTPTDGMKKEAERALAWRKEGKPGGTAVGIARARQLKNKQELSASTVRRMFSFFSRHEVDKEAEGFSPGENGYPSKGRVAWALWGGDAGFSWSRAKVKQLNRIDEEKSVHYEDDEEDEVEEEVLEEKKGKDHDGDGDIDSDDYLMARDKAIKANLKEWGSSDWHYFLDAMHTDLGKPTDAPDIFKVLDVAGDAVDKYWDDWEEYETDREGLNMHAAQTYLRTKFPEYFKGMQALFAPMNETIDEEYNVGKGMEKDHDFDAMLDHALKLHAGTSIEDLKKVAHDFTDVNYHREVAYLEDAIDMLEAGKHEEFEDSLKLFKDEVEKTIRSFKESIEESLRAWNVIDIDGNVTHEGLSYEEALAKAKEVEGHKIRPTNMMLDEDYDPDQEQLDDEDEIFMPMDDEGRPLEEAINPKLVRESVNEAYVVLHSPKKGVKPVTTAAYKNKKDAEKWAKDLGGITMIVKKKIKGMDEATRGTIHKAAKKGSYPVSLVVVKDGKVINQVLNIRTPEVVPAAFNVVKNYHKHKGATVHIEDKTGKR